MNSLALLGLVAAILLPVNIIFALTPFLMRKNLSFSISIPSSEWSSLPLKKLRGLYVLWIVIITIVLGALGFAFPSGDPDSMILVITIADIAAVFLLFIYCWKRSGAIKAEQGWQDTAKNVAVAEISARGRLKLVSPLWLVFYGVIIAVTVLMGLAMYPGAPDEIVMQTDLAGEPTRVIEKTISILYFAPVMQAFIAVIFGFCYFVIVRAADYVDPDQPEVSSKQNSLFKRRWSGMMIFGGVLMLVLFSAIQFNMLSPVGSTLFAFITLAVVIAFIIIVVVLAVKTGQSGSRIKAGKSKSGGFINRNDDKYWKLGSFYYNPDDPAVFIEKRFGIGWTNNFARWQSWAMMAVLAVIIIAIVIFSMNF